MLHVSYIEPPKLYVGEGLQLPPEFSPEVEDVFNSMPNPLTDVEKNYMAVFIDTNVDNGNWWLMDTFSHFGLQDPVNALWCWKRKVTMTNNGAVHLDGVGMEFDGVSAYLDSNYNPAVDGVNYKQDDAIAGGFIINGVDGFVFGMNTGNGRLGLVYENLSFRINGPSFGDTSTPNSNTLYLLNRIISNNSLLYENGVSKTTSSELSETPNNENIYIGGLNAGGLIVPFTGTISSFIAGAAIGFNHLSYYQELVKLNDGLA